MIRFPATILPEHSKKSRVTQGLTEFLILHNTIPRDSFAPVSRVGKRSDPLARNGPDQSDQRQEQGHDDN